MCQLLNCNIIQNEYLNTLVNTVLDLVTDYSDILGLSTITGLDWTTGLSLKLRACQYINTYDVFVHVVNKWCLQLGCSPWHNIMLPLICVCIMGALYILYYVHVRNLCINHRCIRNVGMLDQPSGKHSCLRYSTYMSLQCINYA